MNNLPYNDELVSAYLDGELTTEEQARVEGLLQSDPSARQLLDELRAISATLQDLPQQRLDDDLSERVLRLAERKILSEPAQPRQPVSAERVPRRSHARRHRSRIAACGCVVAAAACVLIALNLPSHHARRDDVAAVDRQPELEVTGEIEIRDPMRDGAVSDVGGAGDVTEGLPAEPSEPVMPTIGGGEVHSKVPAEDPTALGLVDKAVRAADNTPVLEWKKENESLGRYSVHGAGGGAADRRSKMGRGISGDSPARPDPLPRKGGMGGLRSVKQPQQPGGPSTYSIRSKTDDAFRQAPIARSPTDTRTVETAPLAAPAMKPASSVPKVRCVLTAAPTGRAALEEMLRGQGLALPRAAEKREGAGSGGRVAFKSRGGNAPMEQTFHIKAPAAKVKAVLDQLYGRPDTFPAMETTSSGTIPATWSPAKFHRGLASEMSAAEGGSVAQSSLGKADLPISGTLKANVSAGLERGRRQGQAMAEGQSGVSGTEQKTLGQDEPESPPVQSVADGRLLRVTFVLRPAIAANQAGGAAAMNTKTQPAANASIAPDPPAATEAASPADK